MVLIIQVGDNTQARRGQATVERSAAFTEPYLSESRAPSVLAKIKAVDGPEPVVRAYVDRYGLTYEEAAVCIRHVLSLWTSLEAEYAVFGASQQLESRIRTLFPYPDQEMWSENGGQEFLSTPEFRNYIERLRGG